MDGREQLERRLAAFRGQKLCLDMTRGKPGPEQLDICNGMLTMVDENNFRTPSGLDVRNYGGLDGFPEAKRLFARAHKPNLFIKIPGTKEGLPAIEEAIYSGVSVNVTLLFSSQHCLDAADAYMKGLERRVAVAATHHLPGLGHLAHEEQPASVAVLLKRIAADHGLVNNPEGSAQ